MQTGRAHDDQRRVVAAAGLSGVGRNDIGSCLAVFVDVLTCDTDDWTIAEEVLLDLAEDATYDVCCGDVALEEVSEWQLGEALCGHDTCAS